MFYLSLCFFFFFWLAKMHDAYTVLIVRFRIVSLRCFAKWWNNKIWLRKPLATFNPLSWMIINAHLLNMPIKCAIILVHMMIAYWFYVDCRIMLALTDERVGNGALTFLPSTWLGGDQNTGQHIFLYFFILFSFAFFRSDGLWSTCESRWASAVYSRTVVKCNILTILAFIYGQWLQRNISVLLIMFLFSWLWCFFVVVSFIY